jgi:DNA primase
LITKDSIDNLKNSLDIVDTVSNYIELKKAGSNFKGLCPFHGEKTSSFVVSPVKQIYHCFGCGVSGDSISFVMDIQKLSYPDAIEKLAKENNITLSYDKGHQKQDYKVMEQVNSYFVENLKNNKIAYQYLLDRGIKKESIDDFSIGYAPSSGETMSFFDTHHIAKATANEYGLIATGDSGVYARFIERVTFPIKIANSNIVGFGGRTISNHPAKYINSPTTKYFNKSKVFYGLDVAKTEVYKKEQMIITEGYLDVIMLHQAGYKNTVATLGTALTKEHIPILKKIPAKIILAYDGDKAGAEAAFKASYLLSSFSIDGSVALFVDGLDPADLVKNKQLDKLEKIFAEAKPLVLFVFFSIASKYNLKLPEEKQRAFDEINVFFNTLNPLLKEAYKKDFASAIDIDEKLIKTSLKKSYKESDNTASKLPEDMAELSTIKTLIEIPKLIEQVLDFINPNMFRTHKSELELVINNNLEDSRLIGISLRDDIKLYNEDEIVLQLCKFLIKYYQKERDRVKSMDISLGEFGFVSRSIEAKIRELKKGVLVEFESFVGKYSAL